MKDQCRNKTMQAYIYSLSDPFTGSVKYIGKTISPTSRLINHISRAKNSPMKDELTRWLFSLLQSNVKPIFKIEYTCNAQDVGYWEGFYYEKYQASGLLNSLFLSTVSYDSGALLTIISECKRRKMKHKEIAEVTGLTVHSIGHFMRGDARAISSKAIKTLENYLFPKSTG